MINSINKGLHTSATMPICGPAPNFIRTFTEQKSGVLRPRLVENKVDPDLAWDIHLLSEEQKRQYAELVLH